MSRVPRQQTVKYSIPAWIRLAASWCSAISCMCLGSGAAGDVFQSLNVARPRVPPRVPPLFLRVCLREPPSLEVDYQPAAQPAPQPAAQ